MTLCTCSLCMVVGVIMVTIMVVPLCDSQGSSCAVSVSKDNGTVAVLACFFPYDLQRTRTRLKAQRFDNYGDVDHLLECAWDGANKGYQCEEFSRLVHVPAISNVSGVLGVNVTLSAKVNTSFYPNYVCYTDYDSVIPMPCLLPGIDPPDPPLLYVNQTTTSTIQVSWDTPDTGWIPVLGFDVSYKEANDTWKEPIHLGASNTSFLATDLLCGTVHRFVVQAFNTEGVSPESHVLEVKTNGSAPAMPTPHRRLLKEVNATAVTLSLIGWEINDCPIQFFTVKYRLWDDLDWDLVNDSISSDTRELTVKGLEPLSVYMMLVTAHSEAGPTPCAVQFTTADGKHGTDPNGKEHKQVSDNRDTIVIVVMAVVLTAVFVGIAIYCIIFRRNRMTLPIDNTAEVEQNTNAETELSTVSDVLRCPSNPPDQQRSLLAPSP